MTPGYKVVLLTIDHVQMAVAQDLSSRYCPRSNVVFLARFWALFAVFAAAALAMFLAASCSMKRPSNRTPLYIVAGASLLFAIGSGALVLYGVSGCSGAAAEGLIWDWPW
jgi:CHASE2 domain-containing sensor protein